MRERNKDINLNIIGRVCLGELEKRDQSWPQSSILMTALVLPAGEVP